MPGTTPVTFSLTSAKLISNLRSNGATFGRFELQRGDTHLKLEQNFIKSDEMNRKTRANGG